MSIEHDLLTHHDREILGPESLIYPVISRRVGGVSVGINTCPHDPCSLHCLYCEAQARQTGRQIKPYNVELADRQLRDFLQKCSDGRYLGQPIKAITLSGDAEPTHMRGDTFSHIIKAAVNAKREFGLDQAKLVVISNALGFGRKEVIAGLETMYEDSLANEVWAKLDAGSQEYFETVSGSKLPLDRIANNIMTASSVFPMRIQTCFMNIDGFVPDAAEIGAYISRINGIVDGCGQIKSVQLYTVRRDTPTERTTPLTKQQMDYMSDVIRPNIHAKLDVYWP
ncbi:MAG: hypothetical protein U0525_05830 [Patescibacteria group bacterium]